MKKYFDVCARLQALKRGIVGNYGVTLLEIYNMKISGAVVYFKLEKALKKPERL